MSVLTKAEIFYERQYAFALNCQKVLKVLPQSSSNRIYSDQLLRSSSSIGANYIEALEGVSRKDFAHRIKISRKEARESIHWLRLIHDSNTGGMKEEINILILEATEFKRIFTSSLLTLEKSA